MVGGEPPQVWLGRTCQNRATDFVRWFAVPHTGPRFVCEKRALRGLVDFTQKANGTAWLAHNGKSFDFKVLAGVSERHSVPIPRGIQQIDTLHVFRKVIPGHKSYSQPVLYHALFGHKYNAHVAIDDAKALARICKHVSGTSNTIPPTTTPMSKKKTTPMSKKKPMNLTFLKRRHRKAVAKTFPSQTPPMTLGSAVAVRARVLLRKVAQYVK